jgi:type VI secretion system protein ImpF
MRENLGKTSLRPSLLERLRSMESRPASERGVSIAELKRAVRDDLEHLLNTRQRCKALPPSSGEATESTRDPGLKQSLVNYGIPDFTSAEFGTAADCESFRRALEEAIQRYEPRLSPVQVTLVGRDEFDRTLKFRIDAVLLAEPVPEPVVFNSALEPMTGEISVREGEP